MSRCSGHCCRDIGLALSPEELRASYMRFVESQGGHLDRHQISAGKMPRNHLGGRSSTTVYEDIHLIYPMLTFTHQDAVHPDVPEEEVKLFGSGKRESLVYHYTCKHFDGANCTIYDIRPRMCSGFAADAQGCGYKGCTWTDATKWREDWRESRKPCSDVGIANEFSKMVEG